MFSATFARYFTLALLGFLALSLMAWGVGEAFFPHETALVFDAGGVLLSDVLEYLRL